MSGISDVFRGYSVQLNPCFAQSYTSCLFILICVGPTLLLPGRYFDHHYLKMLIKLLRAHSKAVTHEFTVHSQKLYKTQSRHYLFFFNILAVYCYFWSRMFGVMFKTHIGFFVELHCWIFIVLSYT